MPIKPSVARVRGFFHVTCRRKDGSIRWRVRVRNGVTYQGLDFLFDCGFRGSAAVTWYAGVIAAGGFSAVSSSDTAASHAGWVEYVGVGSRPALSWDAAAGGAISSTGSVSISVTSTGDVRGFFMASSLTVGGSAGVLYATADLGADYGVVVGDTIYLAYDVLMG